ncbi:MAG: thermonuclease family protein [Desulfococcaceae bacterium]
MKYILLFLLLLFSPFLPLYQSGADFTSAKPADTAVVVHVIDGDTVILSDGRHVRYIGINTPEIPKPDQKGEPFSRDAAKYNRELVKGKKVRLEYDRTREDQYGRTLAWLWLKDGTLVNEQIIGEGYAHCLYDSKNSRYFDRLLQIQRKAMSAGKGMWRNLRRGEKEKLVGNTRSLRFHEIHCDLAKQVSRKNRKDFYSRWDAFWEGYAPSKKCRAD